jgi:hypothetical protein
MKSYEGVGMYLQEFLTPLSEDGQSASGPGHFTRRETSFNHWTGIHLLKQKRSVVGQKNLVFVLLQEFEQNCWSSSPQPSHYDGGNHKAVRKSHVAHADYL